ncbi:hypothetical protein KKB10_00180 [Patescibacteria group bacterium]|nr:hypothetical protein [Patescibacteria group bacterium]MBU1075029.1 hypothetical protein [Patescibacteria group bacterium]MBU1951799.1 hypothetical protein [Patescibacteria group bacterium]MBU2229163.1 hypothetical protein [Patescibacteria group bacterium]
MFDENRIDENMQESKQVEQITDFESLPPIVSAELSPVLVYYNSPDRHGIIDFKNGHIEDLGDDKKQYIITGAITIRRNLVAGELWDRDITITITTENNTVVDVQNNDEEGKFYMKEE